MRRITILCAAVAFAGFIGATAQAAENVKANLVIGRSENFDSIPNQTGLNEWDRKFMKKAAIINMFEIKAGELAMRKGTNEWTKNFGWEMVREHTMAHENLKLLAADKGFNLPDGLDQEHRAMLRKLERLSGSRFDNAYREMMVLGHGEAEKLAAQGVKFGHDTFVRSFAEIMFTSTSTHRDMSKERELMVNNPRETGGRLAQPIKP